MSFVHLHNHTQYSLFDGISTPKSIIAKAKELGQPAVALTDNSALFGYPAFSKLCKKEGIKPIFGMYAYIAARGRLDKEKMLDRRSTAMLLYATNQQGYQNMMMLSSLSYTEGFYYRPRLDYEIVAKHSEGLVAAFGASSRLGQYLKEGDVLAAEKWVAQMDEIFTRQRYYVEITRYSDMDQDQRRLSDQLLQFAQDHDLQILATNATRFTSKEDHSALNVLTALRDQTIIDAPNHFSYSQDAYMKSTEEMQELFSDVPEAIENSIKIADMCDVDIEWNLDCLPKFDCPDSLNDEQYLRKLCYQGIEKRYGFDLVLEEVQKTEMPNFIGKDLKMPETDYPVLLAKTDMLDEKQKEIIARLEFELQTVTWMGFDAYFLIVWDFIDYAKQQGIMVGPGRGSAAGSIVAYSLEITDLDPLKYDLLFERFLNPDRISMPDIDIDFADTRRTDVVKYVTQKYGSENVAQVVTYGTMAARGAMRDVGRALGIELSRVDFMAKLIPGKPGTKLKEAFEVEEFKTKYDKDEEMKLLVDTALKLEWCVRHTGTHACAVIISDKPLVNYCALMPATGDTEIQTQYEYPPMEDIGLLKMDFLWLKNLTVIQRAMKIIDRRHGVQIDINGVDLEDEKVYELFAAGQTTGVFQFESSGMKKYLKDLKPTVFDDIIAMAALYRPGPLNSGMTESFVKRKNGEEEINYPHSVMESALKDTYGVVVYQEQIMNLSKTMAGFTGGQADVLRKAMGKKIAELMEKMKIEFLAGCKDNNIDARIAEEVWHGWEEFAKYGFNKSHSACYALVAYQTAFLKAHYPVEFMASLLTSDQENLDRVVIELEECESMGITITPPNINLSLTGFTVVDDTTISVGFVAIKGLGEKPAHAIVEEREKNGPFAGLADFVTRVPGKMVNKKSLEALIKAGAMDEYGDRKVLLENMEHILSYARSNNIAVDENQMDMFSLLGDQHVEKMDLRLESAEKSTKQERLEWEQEVLGMYISENPLKDLRPYFKSRKVARIGNLEPGDLGSKKRFGGQITSLREITTKKGDKMAFLEIDDGSGKIESTIFPKTYEKISGDLEMGKIAIFEGKIDEYKDELKLMLNTVQDVDMEAADELSSGKVEKVLAADTWLLDFSKKALKSHLQSVKEILDRQSGPVSIRMKIQWKEIGTPFAVIPSIELYAEIEEVGEVSVKV